MSDELVAASRCAWCSAAAPIDATRCPACGAALAQREDLGGVMIAGLTGVDPALLDADGRPLHIPKSSPTQGMAGGVMLASMAGGPVGLAALGGLAVVGAAEYAMAGRAVHDGAPAFEDVGRPSEVALQALERLAAKETGGSPGEDADDPWRDVPADDPWRDVPSRDRP
jgi:hypothetical protein